MKKRALVTIVLSAFLLTSIFGLFIFSGNCTAQNNSNNLFARSAKYSFSENPAYQGDTVTVTIIFSNDDSNQARIEKYGIHMDWQATGVYTEVDDSSNPIMIASTQSSTVTVGFTVPLNALISSHTYKVWVHYAGWNGLYWEGADLYGDGYDFQVKEKPYLYSVTIDPSSATLYVGDYKTFTASCEDQYGYSYTSVTYTWEVVGNIGSVTSSGTFTATNEGSGSIKITASGGGKTVTSSASITVYKTSGGGGNGGDNGGGSGDSSSNSSMVPLVIAGVVLLIIALIIIAVVSNKKKNKPSQIQQNKYCVFCGKSIPAQVIRCPYCGK